MALRCYTLRSAYFWPFTFDADGFESGMGRRLNTRPGFGFPECFYISIASHNTINRLPLGKGEMTLNFFLMAAFLSFFKPFLLCFWVYLTVAILLRGVSKNPVALRIRLGADVSVSVLHFVVYSNIR